MKTDYINGIYDGIKGNKRGFVDNQKLYDASYKEGFELACVFAGIDEETGRILRLSGGFILSTEQEVAAFKMAKDCINQCGEIGELY